jgi:hypothetical protein
LVCGTWNDSLSPAIVIVESLVEDKFRSRYHRKQLCSCIVYWPLGIDPVAQEILDGTFRPPPGTYPHAVNVPTRNSSGHLSPSSPYASTFPVGERHVIVHLQFHPVHTSDTSAQKGMALFYDGFSDHDISFVGYAFVDDTDLCFTSNY